MTTLPYDSLISTGLVFGGQGKCAALIAAVEDDQAIGITPGVSLLSIKVVNKEDGGTLSDLLAGVKEAVSAGADVLSISAADWTASQSVYDELATILSDHPTIVAVAAGGNEPDLGTVFPASSSRCIGGAPLTKSNTLYAKANQGAGIVLAAPGCDLLTIAKNGNRQRWRGCYSLAATPIVAGLCACSLAFPRHVKPHTIKTGVHLDAVTAVNPYRAVMEWP